MRIVFYVGYQSKDLDPTTVSGIGGTEIALRTIAKEMVKFGHQVIVSGQVQNLGLVNGVEWIHTDQLHERYFNQIDVIVSASYIHFMVEFENYNAKKVLWAHNTHHHPWFRGEMLPNADELTHQVDMTVCLTQWHADQWANKYNIPQDKITIIGNGIDTSTFIGQPEKIKNKFIWSSAPERGLAQLLEYWPTIKKGVPSASLDIYYPDYARVQIREFERLISRLDGVNVMGTRTQAILHDAMLRADYWCYMTDYEETYCITALEMQYANVLPIVTRKAALNETVHGGIINNDNSETNWLNAIQTIYDLGSELKQKVLDANHNWAKCQTWDQRSYDWKNMLESL